MSLPILSTDVGGVSEVVRDKIDGILVPSGDVIAFADGLIELSKTWGTEENAKIVRQRIVDEFTLDNMFNKHIELFESLLDQSEKLYSQ